MEKLRFSTNDIISQSWAIFRVKWTQLFGVMALVMVASSVAGSLVGALQQTDLAGLVPMMSLAVQIFSIFLSIGMIKLILAMVRDQQIDYSELFGGGKYLLQYLLGSLVTGLVMFLGYLLLIVPGIIWSIKYMFTLMLVVDEGMDFSLAMKESAQMTVGIKWQLFCFAVALGCINLLGMLALVVGLIVTVPLTSLAMYVLYDVLRKQIKNPVPAEEQKSVPAPITI